MKTKICPYCGKELSAEAVLCKFCHNLLIDEDGKVAEEDSIDDRTRVFKKPDDDMTKRFVLPEAGSEEKEKSKAVIAESNDDDVYEDDNYDDYEDEEFDDDYEEDAARKRLFAITAVITVGVLIIVIAAILIGMRLVDQGGGNGNKPLSGKPTASQPDNTESEAQAVVDPTATDTDNKIDIFIPDTNTDHTDEGADASVAESKDDFSPVIDYTSEAENEADTDSSLVNFVNSGSPTVSHRDEDDSANEENANSQPEMNISDLEETVRRAVAGNISGEITGSQFRSEENGYAYYYFFTENGAHGYSVAYNINTGSYVCEQNY